MIDVKVYNDDGTPVDPNGLAAMPLDEKRALLNRASRAGKSPYPAGDGAAAPGGEAPERAEVSPLPWRPFPLDTLPPPVADYVRAQAAALNVEPAMIAVAALPVMAAAVGNARSVQVKRSWEEPATLWACVIGRSGTRKSPALDAALRPVYALEAELKEEFDRYRAEYDALDDDAQAEAERPRRTRLRVGDTTAESVVRVHSANERGLLLARDELGAWLGSFDRYASKGEADLQNWIELYEARPVVIDRKSSTPPVLNIARPAVSVAGGIQPGVLRKKLSEEHFASGFAARLLFAMPPERPRRWTEADVSEATREEYHQLVRRLYALEGQGREPVALPLTHPAKEWFAAFVNSNAKIQEQLPDGPLRSFLSKVEAVAARLALVLQVAADPAVEEVGATAMQSGVWLAEWLRYETARIYQREGFAEKAKDRDERLAAKLPETFGWQDVADVWGVKKRAAQKRLHTLREKGLAEKTGHGEYRRCTVHFMHFVHFAPSESAQSARSA